MCRVSYGMFCVTVTGPRHLAVSPSPFLERAVSPGLRGRAVSPGLEDLGADSFGRLTFAGGGG